MLIKKQLLVVTFLFSCITLAPNSHAFISGQIDTFDSGTTEGWGAGANISDIIAPKNIENGGPMGAGDNYLKLTSLGQSGPGSRLVGINQSQWSGNYILNGIQMITADFNNLGQTDLNLRLYLENPQGAAITTTSLFLPTGSGWLHGEFAINANSESLTVLAGDITAILQNVSELRIMHNPNASFPGPAIAAVIGVDNITAVPLPPAFTLFATGLAAFFAHRKQR